MVTNANNWDMSVEFDNIVIPLEFDKSNCCSNMTQPGYVNSL